MPKVSDAHVQSRRQQIIEATCICMAQKGFHQTTMRDVCRTAGLSPGAVYGYFSSKEELLFAVFESINDGVAARLDALLSEGGPAPATLLRLLRLGASFVTEQVEMQAVSLDFWAASRGNALEERFQAACLASYRRFRKIVTDFLRDGQARGEFAACGQELIVGDDAADETDAQRRPDLGIELSELAPTPWLENRIQRAHRSQHLEHPDASRSCCTGK